MVGKADRTHNSRRLSCGVEPLVRRARGPMMSVYFRDPDGNLIEVSNYGEHGA